IWSGKSHDRDSSGRIFLDTEKGRNFPDAGGGTCLFRRGTWKDEQDISPALPQTSCKRILERSCPSGGNQQLGSHLYELYRRENPEIRGNSPSTRGRDDGAR